MITFVPFSGYLPLGLPLLLPPPDGLPVVDGQPAPGLEIGGLRELIAEPPWKRFFSSPFDLNYMHYYLLQKVQFYDYFSLKIKFDKVYIITYTFKQKQFWSIFWKILKNMEIQL